MLIGLGSVLLVLLLAATKIVHGTSTTVAPANYTRIFDTRPCSKLEYYDKLKQKCRDFPGGGFLVIMDHSAKCAHGDSGLHTFNRRDFYYVCHPEGVMIGLCPENTVFSDTEKRCIVQSQYQPSTIKVHDESQNGNVVVPDCNAVGIFPIPSNCSYYFKCQEHNYNFHQYVYQCPQGMFFHPDLQKCSSSNKCYEAHEDILHNFNRDFFPECRMKGLFRTSRDCGLFYACVPNLDDTFYQIRYECPYKMYYNIEKEFCIPEHFQTCDYIPYERIIENYKQQHELSSSTSNPHPTTVISAINTKITTCIPAYRETTQPLNVHEAESLVRETGPTTEIALSSTSSAYESNFGTEESYVSYELDSVDYTTPGVITPTSNEDETFSTDVNLYENTKYEVEEDTSAYEMVQYDTSTAPTVMDVSSTRKTCKSCRDDFEWHDDAWDITRRSKETQKPSNGSEIVQNEAASEVSDADEITTVDYGYDNENSPESISTDANAACSRPDDTNTSVNNERDDVINCTTDGDGEIVCNGQKVSVGGYLEMLGYAFQFVKWKDLPDEPLGEPRPVLNFHFSVEFPFSYSFQAQPTVCRTSLNDENACVAKEEPVTEDADADKYFV